MELKTYITLFKTILQHECE